VKADASSTGSICQICGMKFKNNSSLIKHIRVHSGEKPYLCSSEGCKKSFSQATNLMRHLRTHMGIKRFECEICQRKFTSKENMKSHVRVHEAGHKNEKIQCFIRNCNKGFLYDSTFKKHLKSIHASEYEKILESFPNTTFKYILDNVKNRNFDFCPENRFSTQLSAQSRSTSELPRSNESKDEISQEKEKTRHFPSKTSTKDCNILSFIQNTMDIYNTYTPQIDTFSDLYQRIDVLQKSVRKYNEALVTQELDRTYQTYSCSFTAKNIKFADLLSCTLVIISLFCFSNVE